MRELPHRLRTWDAETAMSLACMANWRRVLHGMPHAQPACMPKPYDLRERTFVFACDVVKFCRVVVDRGYIMGRLAGQLVRAGGSIGANLEEAADAQSKADFIAKNFVALKESREARFWLRVIAACEPALAERTAPLVQETSELTAILTATVKKARSSTSRGRVS